MNSQPAHSEGGAVVFGDRTNNAPENQPTPNKFISGIDFSNAAHGRYGILAERTGMDKFGTAFFFDEEPHDLVAIKLEQAKALSLAVAHGSGFKEETTQALNFLLHEIIEQLEAIYQADLNESFTNRANQIEGKP